MDALLGLGVGVGLGAASGNFSCGLLADFTTELQNQLASKTTATRSEHISMTFELRSSIVFEVSAADGEHDSSEDPANIDPLLGDASAAGPSQVLNLNSGATIRRISANDTLQNQPMNDPVTQTAVAKHLVSVVGSVDNCSWAVRTVKRANQGWVFQYLCKESWQNWTRQAAKNPPKTAVGEWSNKDGQDPVNMSRPAFDCRGQLTIEFLRQNRTISVKYEHTCLHSTVSSLLDLLAPPPPPVPARVPKEKVPKAPKAPRAPKTPKTPKSQSRKRSKPDGEAGEGSTQPNKRRKKKSTAGTDGGAPDASQNDVAAPAGPPSTTLNLSAEEVLRRRTAARAKLAGRGVDPDTLSEDQMEIFQNQSPELQDESLEMLVKYGAERLRIVHPSASAEAAASAQAAQADMGGGQTTPATPATPSSATKTKKPRSRKKSDRAAAASQGESATPGSAPQKRQTRGACEACKAAKQKCDHARPSCTRCLDNGGVCYYAPPKPRKSIKSAAVVEDDSEQTSQVEQAEPLEPESRAETPVPEQADEDDPLGSPGFTSHNVNNTLTLPTASDQPHNFTEPPDFYQSTGLTPFPTTADTPMAEPQYPSLDSVSVDRFDQDHDLSTNGYLYTPTDPPIPQHTSNMTASTNADLTFSERSTTSMNAVTQPQLESPRQSRAKARRSLPTGQPTLNNGSSAQVSQVAVSVNSLQEDSWQLRNTSSAAIPNTNSQTPTSRLSTWQAPSRNPTPTSAAPVSSYSQQASYQQTSYTPVNQQQTVAVPQPEVLKTTRSPQVQNVTYPAIAQAARAKSRQGHRAQTRTPIQDMSAVRQKPPAPATTAPYSASTATQAAAGASSGTSYDGYQYSTTRAEASNSRVAYEPYTSQSNSNRYSYDYNNQSTPVTQNVSATYTATATDSTPQWGTTSASQSGGSHSYNKGQNVSTSSSHLAANNQQAPLQQAFNVRPQSNVTQARSSTGTYGQGQQSGYTQYQAQPSSTNQQNNWYGTGFTAANTSTAGYTNSARNSGTAGYTNSGSHGQSTSAYGQGGHHRSMGLHDGTFNSNISDDYFSTFRGNSTN